jgi:tetratricopeptide (TPR) repeat protein
MNMKNLKNSLRQRWLSVLAVLTSLLSSTFSFSQSCAYDKVLDESVELCTSLSGRSLISDNYADEALNSILNTIGASKRFILKECSGVKNATAASYKGVRYIFYNSDFMRKVVERTNDWSNVSILAHEVGHHINGHTMQIALYSTDTNPQTTLKENRKQELEADEFSGFVLAQLGASKEQAQQVMKLISSDFDDSQSSHPAKSKRLDAIANGYDKGLAMKGKPRVEVVRDTVYVNRDSERIVHQTRVERDTIYVEQNVTYEDLFYQGVQQYLDKEYSKAEVSFNKSIDLNPSFAPAYNNLGLLYNESGDFAEATDYFDKAFELDPSFVFKKNQLKALFNDEKYQQVAESLNEISLTDIDAELNLISGLAYFNISDFNKASEYLSLLDENDKTYNVHLAQAIIAGASGDHTQASACFTKALKIKSTNDVLLNRAIAYIESGEFDLAETDVEKVIANDPNLSRSYLLKGNIFYQRNRLIEACENWQMASDLGDKRASELSDKYCLAVNLLKKTSNEED